MLLAAIGIDGLIVFAVQQRRLEIGIRLALGATPFQVRNMVVSQGMRLTLAGVVAAPPPVGPGPLHEDTALRRPADRPDGHRRIVRGSRCGRRAGLLDSRVPGLAAGPGKCPSFDVATVVGGAGGFACRRPPGCRPSAHFAPPAFEDATIPPLTPVRTCTKRFGVIVSM